MEGECKTEFRPDPSESISVLEKVRSWIASTSDVEQMDPRNEPETESLFFELTHHPLFIDENANSPGEASRGNQQKVFIPKKGHSEDVSCTSVFRKYLPTHASDGSKLIPGFLKTVRRRQSIALLRKHAFRWATISSKKFVMIRTDGCNMVPWTDVNEYFFPLCDDPTCEIVLLALKYAMGYPRMIRHIHPCSQREQLRFGDLFKVVSFGTILVDIDAVLANKGVLWNLVEEMHASCNPGLMMSKCSYRCPEKQMFPNGQPAPRVAGPVAVLSQHARANSPWDGVMDFQNDQQTVYVEHSKNAEEATPTPETDLIAPSDGNIVQFLGEQATKMWSTLSESKPSDARQAKSCSDVSASRDPSKTKDLTVTQTEEPRSVGSQLRNQRSLSATVKRMTKEISCQEDRLDLSTPASSRPTTSRQRYQLSGPVVGLRVNNSRLLPVIVPGDSHTKASQELNKWLVPVFLVQNICLNAHVAGKLIGVYRDFIVGRTCKTPGGRGFVRLCSRQEGRDLTRWLFFMSEKASLIPNWTIVTSRCLLMQWKDFLQYLPGDMIQTFELDLSLSVLKMGQQNNYGPIDAKDGVCTNVKTYGRRGLEPRCLTIKKFDQKTGAEKGKCKSQICTKHNSPLEVPKAEGYDIPPDWYPTTNWSTQLPEEHALPFPQLGDPNWTSDPLATTEVVSPGEEFQENRQDCQASGKFGSGTDKQTKLPHIVGMSLNLRGSQDADGEQAKSSEGLGSEGQSNSVSPRLSGAESPRVKPNKPMKGRKYSCKPKRRADENLAVDGRGAGSSHANVAQPFTAAETSTLVRGTVQKQKRKYTRRSSKSTNRGKEQPAKGDKIPTELINNQSYEKYVRRRNQADDSTGDLNLSTGGTAKSEATEAPAERDDTNTTVGSSKGLSPTVGSSKGFSPTVGSHKGSSPIIGSNKGSSPTVGSNKDSSPTVGSNKGSSSPMDGEKSTLLLPPNMSQAPNTEKPGQSDNGKVEKPTNLRPRNPTLGERKPEKEDVRVRKNHFEGLTLWGEEDEIPEMKTYFKPSKASSQPLKQCLKTKGKKPPSKTVSWHIPGVYPREEQSGNRVASDQGPKTTVLRKPTLKSSGRSKTVVDDKKTVTKPVDIRPKPREPGGDFRPRTSNAILITPCTPSPSAETNVKREKGEDAVANKTTDAIKSFLNVSPVNHEALPRGKVSSVEPDATSPAETDPKDPPEATTSDALRKAAMPKLIKAESYVFSPNNRTQSIARIYTGSSTKQQELISKRITLGRKNAKSESKIPQPQKTISPNKDAANKEKNENCKVDKGDNGRSPVETERRPTVKRSRKPKRKRESCKPRTVSESACCDSILTAWAVKPEPVAVPDLEQHEDQKLFHAELHGEAYFKLPVDRTEVVKTCSIVEQQQKLLEAIQKKSKAKPKDTKSLQQCLKHSSLKATSISTIDVKQEPPDDKPQSTSPEKRSESPSDSKVSLTCRSSMTDKETNKTSAILEQKLQYSFQPQFDPGNTVSNRGLALFEHLVLPYVAMNGYKYVTLVDAIQVFSQCQANCRVAKSLLRSHRMLHRTMCSWEQVYGFELTQPNKKPPVRTGDMLLRFDTLMLRLPILQHEMTVRHQNSKLKASRLCDYPAAS